MSYPQVRTSNLGVMHSMRCQLPFCDNSLVVVKEERKKGFFSFWETVPCDDPNCVSGRHVHAVCLDHGRMASMDEFAAKHMLG